ncbi:MAG: hypothetical protein IKD75_09800 [Prevotella sp.]|nr:hypothetical protein [Prevotella sp.]
MKKAILSFIIMSVSCISSFADNTDWPVSIQFATTGYHMQTTSGFVSSPMSGSINLMNHSALHGYPIFITSENKVLLNFTLHHSCASGGNHSIRITNGYNYEETFSMGSSIYINEEIPLDPSKTTTVISIILTE